MLDVHQIHRSLVEITVQKRSFFLFLSEDCGDFKRFVQLKKSQQIASVISHQEMVAEYRARLKDINARPIKKIAEAKARKRQRSLKKMEKLRKKAEAINDTVDTSEKEKMNQIKQ